MAIKFFCPSGHRLSAPDSHVGRKVRCPACRQAAIVPERSAEGADKQASEAKSSNGDDDRPQQGPDERSGSDAPAHEEAAKPVAKKKLPPAPPKRSRPKATQPEPVEKGAAEKSTVPKPPPRRSPDRSVPKAKSRPPLLPPAKPGPEAGSKPESDEVAAAAGDDGDTKSKTPKPPPVQAPTEPKAEPSEPPVEENGDQKREEKQQGRGRRRGRRRRRRHETPPEMEKEEKEAARKPAEEEVVAEPAEEKPRPEKRRPARRRRKVMGRHVYRPSRGHVQSTQWLAFFLALVILFSIVPAVPHVNVESAPGWARLVLAMAAAELVFVVWMLATPDWASTWVVMVVFGFVATIYATGTAMVLATPLDRAMPLGLSGDARHWAGPWFAAVLAVQCLGTYLAGRASTRWHRMFRLEMAGRSLPSKQQPRP